MLRVLIIGAGFMGQTHASIYNSMDEVELVGIVDKDKEKGEKFAKEYNCAYSEDLLDTFNSKIVDFVDICLPTFLHEEYIIKASEYVKYVICEKPITLSMSSLENIFQILEKNNTKLYLGQVLRFWEEYKNAKSIYETGQLGKLRYIEADRLSEPPSWSLWYKKADKSGGGLFDLHLHDIDFLVYLFGKPVTVYANGIKHENDAWNFVNTSMTFSENLIASIHGVISMSENYPFTMKLCMVGDDASYEYEVKAGKNLENRESAIRRSSVYSKNGIEEIVTYGVDAYQSELKHFVECINEDRDSEIVSLKSIKNTMQVMEAIKESLETGRIVTLGDSI